MSSQDTLSFPFDIWSRIPQEILDRIVDHLHDQPRVLKNCSLVSSSWNTSCRPHLFAQVNFRSTWMPKEQGPDKESGKDGRPAIDFSTITPYIKVFTIYRRAQDYVAGTGDPLGDIQSLLDVLSNLPMLRSLAVVNGTGHNIVPWAFQKDVFLGFISALEKSSKNLASLRLVNCTFSNLSELVQLIGACPCLRRLELDGLWWSSGAAPTPELARRVGDTLSASLEELSLGADISWFQRSSIIDWLSQQSHFSNLTSVILKCGDVVAQNSEAQGFLEMHGASLQYLHISSPCLVRGHPPDFVGKWFPA